MELSCFPVKLLLLYFLLPLLQAVETSDLKGADLFIVCQLSSLAHTLNVPCLRLPQSIWSVLNLPIRISNDCLDASCSSMGVVFFFFNRLMDFLWNRISPTRRVLNTARRRSQIGWADAYGWASPTQPSSWLVKSRCRNCQWVNREWSQKSSRLFGGSPEYWDYISICSPNEDSSKHNYPRFDQIKLKSPPPPSPLLLEHKSWQSSRGDKSGRDSGSRQQKWKTTDGLCRSSSQRQWKILLRSGCSALVGIWLYYILIILNINYI